MCQSLCSVQASCTLCICTIRLYILVLSVSTIINSINVTIRAICIINASHIEKEAAAGKEEQNQYIVPTVFTTSKEKRPGSSKLAEPEKEVIDYLAVNMASDKSLVSGWNFKGENIVGESRHFFRIYFLLRGYFIDPFWLIFYINDLD